MKSFKLFFRLVICFFFLFIQTFFISCNYGFFWALFDEENVDERSSKMRSLEVLKPDFSLQTPALTGNVFSVLVITDLHYGAFWGENKEGEFLDWLENRFVTGDEKSIPRFIVNLGDTADGGHNSEYKDYVAFENKIKQLAKYSGIDSDYKIYSILGNHDLYNNGVEGFKDYCFPYCSSYYFHAGGFGFYFLDTANGTLGTSQLESFKEFISSDPLPKVVFTHYPVYAGAGKTTAILMRLQNSMERNTLLTYFSKYNVKQIYEGHIHDRTWFDWTKFREDVIDSFRKGQAAVFTVDSSSGRVSMEIINF